MSYYKEQIPTMIEKAKIAKEQCLEIVDREIGSDLSDDKLHNALKGKKMALEDAIFYSKEVDRLENELSGETDSADKPKINHAKRMAQNS